MSTGNGRRDPERAGDDEVGVGRQPLDVVRAAERRIGERIEAVTASRAAVRAAEEQAHRIVAEARETARVRAAAAATAIRAAAERDVAEIRDSACRQARRLRELAASRLAADADAVVDAVLGTAAADGADRPGTGRA